MTASKEEDEAAFAKAPSYAIAAAGESAAKEEEDEEDWGDRWNRRLD